MRTRTSTILLVFAMVLFFGTLCMGQTQEKPADAELQRFQGTWVLVSAEMDGKTVAEADVKNSQISYVGDRIELITPHQHKEAIIATIKKLDTTKQPAEMHWVRETGPNAGKTMTAIYVFERPDRYSICFDPAGNTVPVAFETAEGSGHIWHTWERVKQ